MATIHREIWIDTPPDAAWAALRDVGALHERLARGFVVETRLEPGARIVHFASGVVLREEIVAIDDERRRVVWSAVSERLQHHNGAAQVLAEGAGTRFAWTADVLPDDAAATVTAMIEAGLEAIRRTLEEDHASASRPLPACG